MEQIDKNNQSLTQDVKSSFLSADASSGASTISLESIVGFAVNLILQIGNGI